MRSILDRAQQHGGFVRLDMEGSAFTSRTLEFFEKRLYPHYPDTVGIVLRSALRRTWTDVERAIARSTVACDCAKARTSNRRPSPFPTRPTSTELRHLHARAHGARPFCRHARSANVRPSRRRSPLSTRSTARDLNFRCCMACGAICRSSSRARRYRLRVYVPFGKQWYPYFMRRLAERPANLAFHHGQHREGVRGTRDAQRAAARVTPGQHIPPEYDKGDESTVGGYAAVHANRRPSGRDGMSYSLTTC